MLLQKVMTPSMAQFASYPELKGVDEVVVAVPQTVGVLLQTVVERALL
jgi:hypothetical protein